MTGLPPYRAGEEGSRALVTQATSIEVDIINGRRRFFSSNMGLFTRRNRRYLASLENSLAQRFGLASVTIEPRMSPSRAGAIALVSAPPADKKAPPPVDADDG